MQYYFYNYSSIIDNEAPGTFELLPRIDSVEIDGVLSDIVVPLTIFNINGDC
jgi:hypothetical protein